jgi:hypothetical protein
MKIISWDVGIRNLAYSVIEYDEYNNENNKLLYWNIINLIPDNNHCYISTCKKPVVQSCAYYGKSVCWCEKHNNIYKSLLIANGKNDSLTKPINVKTINCNNINIDDLRGGMIKKLDMEILPLVYKENINYFLIENQPTLKNPRMKAIADTLYTWALIRCIMDSKITTSLHLISPSNKLKKYAEELLSAENKYRSTKLKSIDVVNDYLNNNKLDTWKLYLSKFTKKDDLCDALLQGFYWINERQKEKQKEAEKELQKELQKEKLEKKLIEKLEKKQKKEAEKTIKTKKNDNKFEIVI